MSNNIFAFSEETKNKLVAKGYKCVDTRKSINGETVWVLNPCGLFFDMNDDEIPRDICFDSGFKLTF